MARKSKQRQARETVALVGDGQTERIYFADVRDTDRPEDLRIFPDQPKKFGSYKGVLERAIALIDEGFDRVYALIDTDKIINDRQQQAYAKAKAAAELKGVIVLENNPCFEVWILLHFEQTGVAFKNCDSVTKRIRRYIPGYAKSERFLVAAKLYARYRERLGTHALPNATLLEADRADKTERYPRAEVFKFFEWYQNR